MTDLFNVKADYDMFASAITMIILTLDLIDQGKMAEATRTLHIADSWFQFAIFSSNPPEEEAIEKFKQLLIDVKDKFNK